MRCAGDIAITSLRTANDPSHMTPKLPHNEHDRLAQLHALDILDTGQEEVFDRITRLAAHIVEAPIVLISLIDEHRQWFKSRIGLAAEETHRDVAFCGYAILDDEVFVVPDASEDPRFADNPLVTGAPDIRFYAGAPLILSDGVRLGTLCAIDTKPRQLTDDQLTALRDLAAVVIDELVLRQSLQSLAETNRLLQEQTTQLQQTGQALEQFAHMASHDLRAPLKKIINLADLALLDAADHVPEEISMIRGAAVELEELVLGYRRLASLEHGVASVMNVSSIIERAVESSGLDIAPVVRGDATVVCDPTLVTQALVNLLDNAAKYGNGSHLAFETTETLDDVTLTATNTVEVPVDVDDSVFSPFRRLTTGGDGTGLGLAIVKRVMQLHDGSATADCSDKTFSIALTFPKQVGE